MHLQALVLASCLLGLPNPDAAIPRPAPTPRPSPRLCADEPDTLYSYARRHTQPFVVIATVARIETRTECRPAGFCSAFPIVLLCTEDVFAGPGITPDPLPLEWRGPFSPSDLALHEGERLLVTVKANPDISFWSCGVSVSCDMAPREQFFPIEVFRNARTPR